MRRIAIYLAAIGLMFGRVAFGATELVQNGGFETIPAAPWVAALQLPSVVVGANPAVAHSGVDFLNLGNVNGAFNGRVYQIISIPTNTLFAQYSFFWAGSSSDAAGSVEFIALVLNTNVAQTTLSNLGGAPNATTPYQQQTFDLTRFAGKTIELAFEFDAPNAGIGVNSSFRVDDVSLQSYTAADLPVNDLFASGTVLTTTTNISVFATNVLATKETGEPKHAGNSGGHSLWWNWVAPGNGEVIIDTAGSTFDTVMGVYTGATVSNLTQVASNDDDGGNRLVTSRVKLLVTAGTEYHIAVDGKNGAIGVVQLNLSFSPDTKDPTVTISSPKSGAKLTNSTVIVQGKAADNLAVALVQVRLENAAGTNDYQNATGTNTWTATVTNLIPGPNTIRVRSFDTSSNDSASAVSTVTFVVVSPITVSITGTGTVSPNLNGQLLGVGSQFTMTAKPGAGQVFSNWTGTVTATTAALTFTMQSNMVLQANFVPNPFTPVVGVYQGLFFDTNAPEHASSGFFSATLASAGSYSAKIMLAGKSYSLAGQFSAGGSASNNIVRKGLTTVAVQLQLDLNAGIITGVFSDGVWTAELNAARPASNIGNTAGHYTLLIPGAADGVGHPGGDSYGTITVSATAGITFSGVLSDGTKAAQKANLLANGQWPFYVSLYSGNGSILGWLTFTNDPGSDISGTVNWFKLANASGKFYPAGFTNSTSAAGSAYHFTAGVPVLNFANGQISFANGNVTPSFTNQVTLDTASKVVNQSTNALKLTITTSSGLFKGSVVNPATGKSLTINGVVLQKQNFGGGFFLGTNQTGRVVFGP